MADTGFWKQVETLLHEAMSRSPEECQEFLKGISDINIRHEVESLLAANGLLSEVQIEEGIRAVAQNWAGMPLSSDQESQQLNSSSESTPHSPRATVRLSRSSPFQTVRFEPGQLISDRYRVVSLLGQGGMGEVYRAQDLKLLHSVALKFLPETKILNAQWRERLYSEVRVARQISHPNVCRVYDIAESEGYSYVTMEYIDGEDLGSLLRRIGRLPTDKALEFARKLAAGLAAAHDRGVLHRDLKPANIMIDGRGQVLITDFGLAGLIGQIKSSEIRFGTPAYMAPEQLAGKEVSIRSDIYALGLVLYEMFTGKRAFENESRLAQPVSVSSLAKGLEPAISRVIRRCMAEDPLDRPHSALAVLTMLPGAAPLMAASPMNEASSPTLVAVSNIKGISVRGTVLCFVLILAGVVSSLVLGHKVNPIQDTTFENPPEVLADKAHTLAQSFGYFQHPRDRAFGFEYKHDFRFYAEETETAAAFREQMSRFEPPLIDFWYRESPDALEPLGSNGRVSAVDPPPSFSGMISLVLDPAGKLMSFSAVPPQAEKDKPIDVDPGSLWKALFTAAGLDLEQFSATSPEWLPLAPFDTRGAWKGNYPHSPNLPLRIEAAAWRGRPVSFEIIGPWTRPPRMPATGQSKNEQIYHWGFLVYEIAVFGVFGVALFLAWHNIERFRGDLHSAAKLAVFAFTCQIVRWWCFAHHTTSIREMEHFLQGLSLSLLTAALVWLLYIALEPYVRRRWPESLITWNRLLSGDFRDPLVGTHILIGVVFAMAMDVLFLGSRLVAQNAGFVDRWVRLDSLLGGKTMTGVVSEIFLIQLQNGLASVFLFFFSLVLFRYKWLAILTWALCYGGLHSLTNIHAVAIDLPTFALEALCANIVLLRFGALSLIVGVMVAELFSDLPLSTDFSAWYSNNSLLAIVIVLALSAYSFRVALAGRSLINEELLTQ